MDNRARLLAWIGVLAGLFGFLILNFAPLDGLLPLNRVLFSILCALTTIWLLVSVIQTWGDRP